MFNLLKSLRRRSVTQRRPARPVKRTSEYERLSSRPWLVAKPPAEALAVPTMLSLRERQLLYWLARHHVTGEGRVVDGGCFLGGSTAALASGLADRRDGRWKKTIATYDLFRVEDYTLAQFGHCFPNRTIGSSFRSAFDKNIARWSRHVEVREGDAFEWGWSGEPIEVLFLDFVKSWRLNDLVLEQFLPCLIPGHSVIIQQDYLWGFGPWIHLTMELLDPCVKMLDFMPHATVAYLLTDDLPKEVIGAKIRESLSAQRKLELMDRAVERWQGEDRGLVELARIMLKAETFDLPPLRAELADIISRYAGKPRVECCAPSVAGYLADETRSWIHT
jgi:hypothetical protein